MSFNQCLIRGHHDKMEQVKATPLAHTPAHTWVHADPAAFSSLTHLMFPADLLLTGNQGCKWKQAGKLTLPWPHYKEPLMCCSLALLQNPKISPVDRVVSNPGGLTHLVIDLKRLNPSLCPRVSKHTEMSLLVGEQ